jgi:hypothetical protein
MPALVAKTFKVELFAMLKAVPSTGADPSKA